MGPKEDKTKEKKQKKKKHKKEKKKKRKRKKLVRFGRAAVDRVKAGGENGPGRWHRAANGENGADWARNASGTRRSLLDNENHWWRRRGRCHGRFRHEWRPHPA